MELSGGLSIDRESLYARFLRYVQLDTQSDPTGQGVPSTQGQVAFCQLLVSELHALGYVGAELVDGCVYLRVPGRGACSGAPTVGFLAHVDTAPDAPGRNVRPRIVRDYPGGAIELSPGVVLSPSESPELDDYLGQDLVVTDGTTLLGADDKAGVAAIMEALAFLRAHPDFPHAPLAVAFTTDEEIGRGVEPFDLSRFGANFAYTVDGGRLGELQYENFNASSATVRVYGRPAHPGDAQGKMISALALAMDFDRALGPDRPETTGGRQGFFHLTDLRGDVACCQLDYIIRDFEPASWRAREDRLRALANDFSARYAPARVEAEIETSYRNMGPAVRQQPRVLEVARRAMRTAGIEPLEIPIRGGTDGARLTEMGLPCPNLFAGGMNFHSVYEFLPLQSLAASCEVILRICRLLST